MRIAEVCVHVCVCMHVCVTESKHTSTAYGRHRARLCIHLAIHVMDVMAVIEQ